jgi:hypothetical protein
MGNEDVGSGAVPGGSEAAPILAHNCRCTCAAEGNAGRHTVCIGWPTIRRLAAEGMVWFEEQGVGLVAADDLFRAEIPDDDPIPECEDGEEPWVCTCPEGFHVGADEDCG